MICLMIYITVLEKEKNREKNLGPSQFFEGEEGDGKRGLGVVWVEVKIRGRPTFDFIFKTLT